ncbi:MAG: TRAP transporter substrate-binding protein [Hyphomicrobiaceae bacterium]
MKLASSSTALGAFAIAAAAFAAPAMAQTSMTIKSSDVHPLGYPTVEAVVQMGKKLEKATKGRLKIQMFPGGQLGGEKEMIEQAQVGALQMARISVGPMGTIIPELNVFNMPFVFTGAAHMRKVIDGPIGQEMLDKISSNSRTKLIALAWMDAGSRNVYTERAIRKPADLKGLKIRMMGNPLFVDTMNAMGGNGISMGFGELYNALQTGVVDGAENNEPTYVTHNHYTIKKFFSKTEHLIIPEILVFSRAAWDKLSKDDQALIKKLGREAQTEQRALWDAMVEKSIKTLKEKGVTIVSDVDKKAFQDAVKPVYTKYGKQFADLMKRIDSAK